MANPSIMEQGNPSPPAAPVPTGEQAGLLELGAHLARLFSDALTVVNGQAALLLERCGPSSEVLPHVLAIRQAGGRAARLAQQLLIISNRHTLHIQPVDLHALVQDQEPAIRRLLGGKCRLATQLTAAPAMVWTDPDLFEQVLLGLAANARAAMPEGGTLSCTTDRLGLTEADLDIQPAGRPGDFVCLTVRDTGTGMTPETLARATAPFSLTNRAGKSAGFGLAASRSIVLASGGWLDVESQPQAGTTLRLYLPAAPADDLAGKPGNSGPGETRGKNTILLLEDDAGLRELLALVLQGSGYRILQAGSAEEALEAWQWHSPRIDLLFTDIVLSGDLSGLDLAARFQAEKPGLKIICLSGNSENIAWRKAPPLPGIHFLQKPCSNQVIELTIRAMLERGRSG
ncbi:MAG: response regulator [Opitutae bacterium]|nr:response regulator [Opitutae bacterium]